MPELARSCTTPIKAVRTLARTVWPGCPRSMSRCGNCHDNAVKESFFSTVKSELDQFASNGDAKMELVDYIEVFYNQRRRVSTLGARSVRPPSSDER